MKEETTYHIPVLLMPSVDGMNIRPDGTYVDMTLAEEAIHARYCPGWVKAEGCWGSTRTKMRNRTL